jgi:hypothetical protein
MKIGVADPAGPDTDQDFIADRGGRRKDPRLQRVSLYRPRRFQDHGVHGIPQEDLDFIILFQWIQGFRKLPSFTVGGY